MKAEKKILTHLTKCYSIAPLRFGGADHFLVAAEKEDRCLLFDSDGRMEDTVWDGPGGTMTMVWVPGTDGQFLATHKFYSPNDSKEAEIVVVTPKKPGGWDVRTLKVLPHVHRFDILERNGVRYLLACTLKSGHEYRDDWSSPGKVYGAVLPEDLSGFDREHQLKFDVIREDMLKNHGYYRVCAGGLETGLISSESGVYQFIPPANEKSGWEICRLLDTPASDAVLVDFDEDGEMELAVLSPFHGDCITIYRKQAGSYIKAYEYERPAEFTHAIYGGDLCGRKALVVGHRKGERNLLVFTWNKESGQYEWEILDRDCGPANVFRYTKNGRDILICTNREIDEVAMYTVTP
ncbi:hypothetical protein AALB39_26435 [Lachnospiraceae bacterium 54-53]